MTKKPVKDEKQEANYEDVVKKAVQTQPAGQEEDDGIGKQERVEVLKQFTKEVLKLYGPMIRSIVLFGSTARQQFRGESDIDVFIIVDDTRTKITPMMRDRLEDDLDIISKKLSKHLSIQQPYMLTEFWNMVRIGHPIVFNFIREGVPIFDRDLFLPIKKLLQMGEIRPSREAVEKYIERAPKRIKRVENAKIYMVVEDCYYAMLESAQAVLMFLGKTPPRPVDAANVIRKTLVKMNFLEESFVKDLEDIITLRKEVEHKRINDISGKDLDLWIGKADAFVRKMQQLIVKIEILKRENIVEKSYSIMGETAMALLKSLNRAPAKSKPLKKAFQDHLVATGLVDGKYLEVFTELEGLQKTVKEGKILDVPKSHLLMQREYVRKFIREAGRIMKKKLPVGENNNEQLE